MNICYVCNEYPEGPHGGVGTVTQLLAEELVAKKNSVKIIGVYDLKYPSENFEIKNGVEITRIKVNHKRKIAVLWGNWLIARKIRQWIKFNMIDIIECPDSYGLFSLFASFDRPLVLRAHGNNTYYSSILKFRLKRKTAFYERNLYKKANAYCAVSEFTAEKMRMLFKIKESITVIYNGISIQNDQLFGFNLQKVEKLFTGFPNPIVFSGTLTPKKGIYQLVKAVLHLLNKRIKVTLIINGKDSVNQNTGQSIKSELLKLIPSDYNKSFIFNGHVARSDLLCQFKCSKAAVFPSYAEAFAMAPMESMLMGTPTIYSRECSGSELITDKEDGLIIDPYSEESISDAIEYLLNNPEKAIEMGNKGKTKIERNFSKEIMVTKTLMFYGQVQSAFYFK